MNKNNRKILKSLVMITQIGISMMTPVFLSGWIGWWLDRRFHTQVWFLVLLFVGIGAALRNLYMITASFYTEDMKAEHEKLQYIQSLKEQGEKNRALRESDEQGEEDRESQDGDAHAKGKPGD